MQERTALPYGDGPPEHFRNAEVDLDCIRPNPAEITARQANALDENRPGAVTRRRTINQRTALKIAAQLVDLGSFEECGKLAIAHQQRPLKRLIKNTRTDSFIAGVATVKASHYGTEAVSCTTAEYDYTVLVDDQRRIDHKRNEPQEDWPHADAGRGVAHAAGVLRRKAVEVTAARYDRPGLTGLGALSLVHIVKLSVPTPLSPPPTASVAMRRWVASAILSLPRRNTTIFRCSFTAALPIAEFSGMWLKAYVLLACASRWAPSPVRSSDQYCWKAIAELYTNGTIASIASLFDIDIDIDNVIVLASTALDRGSFELARVDRGLPLIENASMADKPHRTQCRRLESLG